MNALKNHYEPTAGLAWLARKQVPGIEIFGGIALNRSVGGVNPAAVDRMTRVKGGHSRGKATMSAEFATPRLWLKTAERVRGVRAIMRWGRRNECQG